MKTVLVLCVVVAAALADDFYDPKYDSFDAQDLVSNIRLLKAYGRCFLDQGPCTSEGTEFKKRIPEALRTNCGKCSPKQRELIRTVVRGFREKLPRVWQQLSEKEDPKGEFKDSFDRFLNSTD